MDLFTCCSGLFFLLFWQPLLFYNTPLLDYLPSRSSLLLNHYPISCDPALFYTCYILPLTHNFLLFSILLLLQVVMLCLADITCQVLYLSARSVLISDIIFVAYMVFEYISKLFASIILFLLITVYFFLAVIRVFFF